MMRRTPRRFRSTVARMLTSRSLEMATIAVSNDSEPEIAQRVLVGDVDPHGMRDLVGDVVDDLLAGFEREHIVSQACQLAGDGRPESTQTQDGDLSPVAHCRLRLGCGVRAATCTRTRGRSGPAARRDCGGS